jgi:hypothetical protein
VTVSPIEKYRARVDELAALKAELEAASRPDPAPAVGRLLEAAGDLLRRRLKVPFDEPALDAALAVLPEAALHAWTEGVTATEVAARVERAADQAVDAALPEQDGDGPTLATWAMQTLGARDRLESARVSLERLAERAHPGAQVALARLSAVLFEADRRARRTTARLTALNPDRRDELAILDVERRDAAWWYGADAGLEHDLFVKALSGAAVGSLEGAARRAHEVVTRKRSRRVSFDELFRFDLGLASEAEAAALRAAAADDPELALALDALAAADAAIDGVEAHGGQALPARPAADGPQVVEERAEFRLLVLRGRQRLQVVVQPRRQDHLAAAAVYLPGAPQRSVGATPGAYGLHFDVGPAERLRGAVARVVVTLSDGRSVTSEVPL